MSGKVFAALFGVLIGLTGVVIALVNEHALVVHPKGVIARQELELIVTNIALMLSIIIPTYILLFMVVWKYCLGSNTAEHDPDHTPGLAGEWMMWGLPAMVVAVMAVITWNATHKLNPYTPIESAVKPLSVQVIALDWKWLFIYPEFGIATLNYLRIPERTPIHLRLTADGSPMNSFWITQLSGQIYSMAGMSTQLHLMADGPGEYTGRAVEINGEGYAGMTFLTKSTSQKEFDDWVVQARQSSSHLTGELYRELVKPFVDQSIILFSEVDENLYHDVINKYMYPTTPVL